MQGRKGQTVIGFPLFPLGQCFLPSVETNIQNLVLFRRSLNLSVLNESKVVLQPTLTTGVNTDYHVQDDPNGPSDSPSPADQ